MTVDIYVQRDGSALIVPSGSVKEDLSPAGRQLVASACEKKLAKDIDGSIIGLDREGAKAAIAQTGEFINRAEVKMKEG